MGVVGCLRGAGRCVHSDIPIAGAGAGWACAHYARVMLKGQSAGECFQQGFRDVLLRWPTIYCEQGLRYSYCEPAEWDRI